MCVFGGRKSQLAIKLHDKIRYNLVLFIEQNKIIKNKMNVDNGGLLTMNFKQSRGDELTDYTSMEGR